MKSSNLVSKNFLVFSFLWTSSFLIFALGIFALSFSVQAQTPEEVAQAREELQDKAKSLEKKLEKVTKEKDSLTKNLQVINGNLTATQRAIQATQTHLQTTQETISRKEGEIMQLEKKLNEQKGALQGMVQMLYDTSQVPVSEIVFHEGNISRLLSGSSEVLTVQDRINGLIDESFATRDQIAQERDVLSGVKKEKERLLTVQNNQKMGLVIDQKETQSDIVEKQATIEELQKKLAELQGDLNTLTGKSYNAKDIQSAVEDASAETGVPKGVLYGFLKMETNLGANTGQCTYDNVVKVSLAGYKRYGSKYKKSIDLLYKREKLFYGIVGGLGYSKDKKVSCTPSAKNYIGQGGAMGVSQFMSDTWNAYASQITAKTGHGKPDPWSLTDGVMALAIKVRNAGATSDSNAAIRKASVSYLGGFNNNYYSGIVYWAKNYKTLFN